MKESYKQTNLTIGGFNIAFDQPGLLSLKNTGKPTKNGNEKPRLALNLLLMTNFVWNFAIDFMPEETMIILAISHVNGCDLMHMYLMEKMNSNYNDCIPLNI